jgi:hypothetical protein
MIKILFNIFIIKVFLEINLLLKFNRMIQFNFTKTFQIKYYSL